MTSTSSLAGKRVLVTGGSRGIGVAMRLAVYQHALYAASEAAISAVVRNLAPELAAATVLCPRRRPSAAAALEPGGFTG